MNTQSEQIDQLFTALAKAQGEMSAASKDCKNPFFNSKYADLGSVWAACRDALSRNGICAIQTTLTKENGDVYLKTVLGHGSGQWISSEIKLDIPPAGAVEIDKFGKEKKINVMQTLGSILTYQKRYQLASIVGVAPAEDDDGNASNYNAPKQKNEQNNTSQAEYKKISQGQAIELRNIISACSKEYKQHITDYLSGNNLKLISDLPEIFFDVVKQGSITARDEYIEYLAEQKSTDAIVQEAAS
jgi:hypothetical protein